MYVDMSGNHHHPYTDMSRKDSGYIDMTVANAAAKYSGKLESKPSRENSAESMCAYFLNLNHHNKPHPLKDCRCAPWYY